MTRLLSLVSFILCMQTGYTQTNAIDYFGQTPPDDTAIVFAQGNISLNNRWESKITFSPNGDELFFVIGGTTSDGIYYSKKEGTSWSVPAISSFQGNRIVGNPYFSLDGSKLYFDVWNSSYTNCDIWVSEKTTTGWADPKIISTSINSTAIDQSYCETADGDVYITTERSGNYDIWCWNHETGVASNLGTKINASSFDSDPCIAPDGSFLIFSSDRSGKIGGQDLFICFKNGSNWTSPINMELSGAQINLSKKHQVSPSLSPDGKYLFFTRHSTPSTSMTMDIYWASTSIISKLKTTFFAPKVANELANVTITTDSTLLLVIPETTFACEYGTANLIYSASLENNSALPAWLTFDASTRTFKGKPTKVETDTVVITATNTDGISASVQFVLIVEKGKETTIDYLGQTPPGITPENFAKGIVSNANAHGRLVFSPDGTRMLWTTLNRSTFATQIFEISYANNQWSTLATPSFAEAGLTANPVYSPEGSRLFFNQRNSITDAWEIRYTETNGSGWSDPKTDGFLLNTSSSFTDDGKVYYSDSMGDKGSYGGIYSATYSSEGLTNIQALSTTINSTHVNYTPYISPDGTYLIFSSSRPSTTETIENMYLYISFKNGDETWTEPKKMFTMNGRFPCLSPDGKYLFFCGNDGNFYWVDANIVDQLKTSTNYTSENLTKLMVYPNPSTGILMVTLNLETIFPLEISVLSASGYRVYSSTLSNRTSIINLNTLPKGMYFIELKLDDEKVFRKIVLK